MNLFLIRHGTSTANLDPSLYFKEEDCDIELSAKGYTDSESAADKVIDIWNKINHHNHDEYDKTYYPTYYNMYHSSFKRSKETARIIKTKLDKTLCCNNVIESPLCREREWADLRNLTMVEGIDREKLFSFYYRPNGGESFVDCYQRAVMFHESVVMKSKYENNIVVAHGEFNKLYMMYLLGWTVEDFNKYKNQKNGEVILIRDGGLSPLTPLRKK